jgi:hypothetical protein
VHFEPINFKRLMANWSLIILTPQFIAKFESMIAIAIFFGPQGAAIMGQ